MEFVKLPLWIGKISQRFCYCNWSRVYACQPKPHRGCVLNLILSTFSRELNVGLLYGRYFEKIFIRDPTWPATSALLEFIYLIVPFWYASAANRSSLVEPWFVFWRDAVEPKYPLRDQTSRICRRSVPKRYDWVLTVPKFSPKFSVTVAESGQ